jgi:hypothetical protein
VDNGEKMRFSLRTRIADVCYLVGRRLVVTQWMYSPELVHIVNVWQGNLIFTNYPIAHVFLTLGLF